MYSSNAIGHNRGYELGVDARMFCSLRTPAIPVSATDSLPTTSKRQRIIANHFVVFAQRGNTW